MAPKLSMERKENLSIKCLNGGIFQYFICFGASKSRLQPKVSQNIQNSQKKNDSILIRTNVPSQSKKSVKFNPRTKIHVMHVWEFAYRQARKDIWQEKGRDRVRFAKKIRDIGEILTPILNKNKRMHDISVITVSDLVGRK